MGHRDIHLNQLKTGETIMHLAFGLDFGTTNSVLSVVHKGMVEVIDIDSLASSPIQTLKSVLFFEEERSKKPSVGQEALENYFEFGGSYGRLMQSIKSFLPSKSFSETYVTRAK
jgi:hypothetical chaperone protein